MSCDCDKTTSYCWTIVDYKRARIRAKDQQTNLVSDTFALNSRPNVSFALSINSEKCTYEKEAITLVLKQSENNNPVKVSIQLWLESEHGQKFGETTVKEHVFNKVDDQFGYNGFSNHRDCFELFNRHEAFSVRCEIVDLDTITLTAKQLEDHFQNQWTLYEEEDFYDAIIKVGNIEFKVSKFVLASQSSVFKCMFLSKFKEGTTSIIEIKDMNEATMKQLVRWVYTFKLEDESNIEELFAAGDKYDIKSLKEHCIKIMTSSFDNDNIRSRLILATMHNDEQLKAGALEYIKNMSKEGLSSSFISPDWIEFTLKNGAIAKEVAELIYNKLIENSF